MSRTGCIPPTKSPCWVDLKNSCWVEHKSSYWVEAIQRLVRVLIASTLVLRAPASGAQERTTKLNK
eukprot:4750739-Amphidinium_carterae.1